MPFLRRTGRIETRIAGAWSQAGGLPGTRGGTGPHLSEDDAGPEELGENSHRP